MAYFLDQKTLLAPTGSTGNNTHTALQVPPTLNALACQFVVEAAGATPTVTWTVQGSPDNVNWYPIAYVTDSSNTLAVAGVVSTSVGAKIVFFDANSFDRFYQWFRVVTTANTNITYRAEIYGHDPD